MTDLSAKLNVATSFLDTLSNRYNPENDVIPGAPTVTWADANLGNVCRYLIDTLQIMLRTQDATIRELAAVRHTANDAHRRIATGVEDQTFTDERAEEHSGYPKQDKWYVVAEAIARRAGLPISTHMDIVVTSGSDPEGNYITIQTDELDNVYAMDYDTKKPIRWEIRLKKDGTWELK